MLKSSKKSLKKQYDDIELEYLKTLSPKYYLQLDSISTAVKYSPQNPNILVSADHTGLGYFIDVNQTSNQQQNTVQELKVKKKAYFNTATIFDLDWHDQSKKIIIGSGDQRCQVIDVESCKTLTENIVHSQSVRRVKSCQFNQSLFASGGKDGKLFLWDIRQSRNQNQILIDSDKQQKIYTGITFYKDQYTLITTQSEDNQVKIWDLRKPMRDQPKVNQKNGQKVKQMQFQTLIQDEENQNKTQNNKQKNQQNIGFFFSFSSITAQKRKIQQLYGQIQTVQELEIQKKLQISQEYKQSLFQQFTQLKQEVSDLNNQKQKHLKGITSLYLSKSEQKLLVNGVNNESLLYKTAYIDIKPPQLFQGHQSNYYTRQVISPCEKYILSGSKDFNLYLWQIQDKKTDIFQQKLQNLKIDEKDIEKTSFGFQPFAKFEGVQQGEINCVDWTQNYQNFIASVGDDKLLYLWDYSTLNQEHL